MKGKTLLKTHEKNSTPNSELRATVPLLPAAAAAAALADYTLDPVAPANNVTTDAYISRHRRPAPLGQHKAQPTTSPGLLRTPSQLGKYKYA